MNNLDTATVDTINADISIITKILNFKEIDANIKTVLNTNIKSWFQEILSLVQKEETKLVIDQKIQSMFAEPKAEAQVEDVKT